MQATRDLLIPRYRRKGVASTEAVPLMEGETPNEQVVRLRTAAYLYDLMERAGLEEFGDRHPQMLRYGTIAVIAISLFSFLALMQLSIRLVAMVVMAVLYKLTGNEAFKDTPLEGPIRPEDLSVAEEHEQRRWKLEEPEDDSGDDASPAASAGRSSNLEGSRGKAAKKRR